MADKEIGMLPATDGVTDDTVIPVYQPGATEPAQKMTGAQFRAFAQDAVQPQVEEAQKFAEAAEKSAKSIDAEAVKAHGDELADIRVGYDGTTYGSAGEAVRKQVNAAMVAATQSNQELIDVRTGYDGTVYPTAGEAVRAQVVSAKVDGMPTFEKHEGNLCNGILYAKPSLGSDIFTPHNGADYYRAIVFKAKPNTSYVITAPVLSLDEGFGQANADGICTQAPVQAQTGTAPVTFINWKVGTGGLGQFMSFKTNDTFLADSAYLVWVAPRTADLTGIVVFEGTDPADYVNVGEYSPENGKTTSPDLIVTEDNLSAEVKAKLNGNAEAIKAVEEQVDNLAERVADIPTFKKHSGNLYGGGVYQVPALGGSVFAPYVSGSYRCVAFRAKPDTEYIITAPSMNIIEGFGQANADGICTQVPVGYTTDASPVTYVEYSKPSGGLGEYIHFKTNDNFLDDTVYLVWKCWPVALEAEVVIFEGTSAADYVNVGEYSEENGSFTSADLLVSVRNLPRSVADKLKASGTAIQPEDFKTKTPDSFTWLNGQPSSFPVLNSFNIGDVQKLFNTARICKADADHIRLTEYYAHIPTMTVIGDKAYIVAFQNKVNTVDTVVHGTIELYIVDLASWTLTKQVSIATPGLACGSDTLKYGGIDPNMLNINDTTLRIIFTTQLSDGVYCICYRDYTVASGSLSAVKLCKISDGTTTHDFNVAGVQAVCGTFPDANPILNIDTQYATYNGEHYIGLGVDACYPNIPILKTTDFVTFTLWATPTVEGNAAHYECALSVVTHAAGTKRLYTATRQTRDAKKMLIMDVSLTDGSVNGYTWVPDANARPLWWVKPGTGNNCTPYLFHMMKSDRTVSTITSFSPNTLEDTSIGGVADVFGMVYPTLAEYGDELVIAYMRAYKLYLAKIPKFPIYTHNQVIPMLNKFLDYFVSE